MWDNLNLLIPPAPPPYIVTLEDTHRRRVMAISGSDTESRSQTQCAKTPQPPIEVESVKCESCGFTEDCTPAYISRLRQRFQGRWLCGLCVEAVKDEVLRSDSLITIEEALNRHISFCSQFRSSSSSSGLGETEHPIFAMGRVLRRSLDSPRHLRSNSSGALPAVHGARGSSLVRSESCFSSISG